MGRDSEEEVEARRGGSVSFLDRILVPAPALEVAIEDVNEEADDDANEAEEEA